ncbi:MAG TPA: KOW domain-containing RNA-binding protein [Firmicutes bacterium]|nr:KOW domain-containing RNA-binding protein [Bacillota bacterium]
MRAEKGWFAVSAAGHDKGKLYVIVGWQDGYYLLADGKRKTLERPKRKKEKHLRVVHAQDDALVTGFKEQKPVRNEDVKRAIKLYQAKVLTK